MLARLVELSLRYKLLVIIAFLVVGVLGYQAVRKLPIDAFPDVTPVQVNVYTEAAGLAAEDVEQLLTTPVESALAGLPKVEEVRSVSLFGLSYVSVYFSDDMDIYFARQLVNERLQQVGDRLPAGYGKPEMGPNTSGLGQVLWYTVERADNALKNAPDDRSLRIHRAHGPQHPLKQVDVMNALIHEEPAALLPALPPRAFLVIRQPPAPAHRHHAMSDRAEPPLLHRFLHRPHLRHVPGLERDGKH